MVDSSVTDKRSPLSLLVIGGILVAALLLSVQIISILYAILFPPLPPVPPDIQELTHDSLAYGVDNWSYSSSRDACDILLFYRVNEGECRITPDVCNNGKLDAPGTSSSQHVAECSGEANFSIFAMQWRVNIAGGYGEDDPTRFNLSREVFWTGSIPPPIESFSSGAGG